ncbi:MAG: hypothetical protein KJO11_10960 [Gemmatimonadetes bacterium]|nr:hypothetical protein [Gemmatimonadota bacterium]
MKTPSYKMTAAALALVTSLVLGACDDDPVGVEEDHQDPVGLVVTAGGVDLVTVQGATVTGTLTIPAGQETAHLDVEFFDDDGDRFVPEDEDEWLMVTIANGTVAEWEQDEPGEFGGHLKGLAAGATTATFEIMHGQLGSASAHADYRSPTIPVVIN